MNTLTIREVAREIAHLYCPMSPMGIDALSQILVPLKFQKGDIVWVVGEKDNLDRINR